MHRGFRLLPVLVLGCLLAAAAQAADYKLAVGTIISGAVSDAHDEGVVFRLDTGGFSERIAWAKFSQDALKAMLEDSKAKSFVEPFIEAPLQEKPKPKPIILRDVPRVDRPIGRVTLFSSFATPTGLTVLALFYLASLFAGYEVAVYRNRPIALVCGVSALLPVIGPVIFLATPTLGVEGGAAGPISEAEAGLETTGPAVVAAGAPGRRTSGPVGVPSGGSLKVAAQAKAAAGGKAERKVFNRGEYTFNRRFVETQFTGFFRVVPTDAERDMVLVIRTPKQEYVGRRISRITANEFFLQLQQGGGTKEVSIGFGEITQMIVRHKDDKE